MNRKQALALLSGHKSEMTQRFAVKHLALFGSTGRDATRADSDVDLLVEFEGEATFDGYMGLKFFLEDLLRAPVDLVVRNSLRPELRPFIEREAVDVP